MDQVLYGELRKTHAAIDTQIQHVKAEARKMSQEFGEISPYAIKDMNGAFLLSPLLVAKAQVLNGMAILKNGK